MTNAHIYFFNWVSFNHKLETNDGEMVGQLVRLDRSVGSPGSPPAKQYHVETNRFHGKSWGVSMCFLKHMFHVFSWRFIQFSDACLFIYISLFMFIFSVLLFPSKKIPPKKNDYYPSIGFHSSGQFITTSAEVTPNGGLVRESPPKMALN